MTYLIGDTSTGSATQYELINAGDGLFILAGANVVSSSANSIGGSSSNHNVTVAGNVFGGGGYDGVNLGGLDLAAAGHRVTVLASGSVGGDFSGITLYGSDNTINNAGSITGDYGIHILASLYQSTVYNSGNIYGGSIAIYSEGAGLELINDGTIRSSGWAFYGSDHFDHIVNRGSIYGSIVLAGDNDLYDGRDGNVIGGTVYGGNGADTFIAGSTAETFDGGLGADTLDFRSAGGAKIYLDNSVVNTGVATGDIYYSFENVKGSLFGADSIYGSSDANIIYGNGGADFLSGAVGADALYGGDGVDRLYGGSEVDKLYGGSAADILSGGSGADKIAGGLGADTLVGGNGNDNFVFNSLAETGDNLIDYSNVAGNNDIISLSNDYFGLPPGTIMAGQFIARADNSAQDADDRFIFRTTDKTLWFDSNGNMLGGLTLIVDLQANATMTYLDITII